MGYFCGTGMHGGKIFLRCQSAPQNLPEQLLCQEASKDDMNSIRCYIESYCDYFGEKAENLLKDKFFVLCPNSNNPYHQLYTIPTIKVSSGGNYAIQ